MVPIFCTSFGVWGCCWMSGRERPADASEPDPSLSYYTNMRDKLQLRLDAFIDTPKHFEKVQWFANYWNNTPVGAEDGLTERHQGSWLISNGVSWRIGPAPHDPSSSWRYEGLRELETDEP